MMNVSSQRSISLRTFISGVYVHKMQHLFEVAVRPLVVKQMQRCFPMKADDEYYRERAALTIQTFLVRKMVPRCAAAHAFQEHVLELLSRRLDLQAVQLQLGIAADQRHEYLAVFLLIHHAGEVPDATRIAAVFEAAGVLL